MTTEYVLQALANTTTEDKDALENLTIIKSTLPQSLNQAQEAFVLSKQL